MSDKTKAFLGQILFVIIGIGFWIYADSSNFVIRAKNDVGSGAVPKAISIIMVVLALIKIVFLCFDKTVSSEKKSNDNFNLIKGLCVIGVLAIYCFCMKAIGFPILTPFMLFSEMCLLSTKKKNYVLFAIIAVAASVILFVAFYYGLDLMLPAGILKKLL